MFRNAVLVLIINQEAMHVMLLDMCVEETGNVGREKVWFY